MQYANERKTGSGREEFPGIKEINDFLERLTFKKAPMGANLQDVYACIQDISAMYRDVLITCKLEQDQQNAGLIQQNAELAKQNDEFAHQNALLVLQNRELAAKLKKAQYVQKNEWTSSETPVVFDRSMEADIPEKKETSMDSAESEIRVNAGQAERQAEQIATKAQADAEKILTIARQEARKEIERLRVAVEAQLYRTRSELLEIADKCEGVNKSGDCFQRQPTVSISEGKAPQISDNEWKPGSGVAE